MISDNRLRKLSNADYREEYRKSTVTGWVVQQLRALREQRGWTQADLGNRAEKTQSAIGRFESESYGNWSANTLLELAGAFDVALEIRFVSWPDFVLFATDTRPEKMYVNSFTEADFTVSKSYQRLADPIANSSNPAPAKPRKGSTLYWAMNQNNSDLNVQ